MTDHRADADSRPEPTDERTGTAQPVSRPALQGEGNYDAARDYVEATRAFVASGRVAEAAREAAPADEGEAAELLLAEQAGRERAREEDPTVDRGRNRSP